MDRPSHIDDKGRASMVDVSAKGETLREALASGIVRAKASTVEAISSGGVPKGDVFATARIAGIMAAKKTSELIPLCHPLRLTHVSVDFEIISAEEIRVASSVRTADRTGVEMEALTAVSVAALTIYDMCKSIDKAIVISGITLDEKRGGKSGEYRRE